MFSWPLERHKAHSFSSLSHRQIFSQNVLSLESKDGVPIQKKMVKSWNSFYQPWNKTTEIRVGRYDVV